MSAISTPDALAGLAGPQAGTAWSVLVERHGVEVWRLMASRMRDVHEAEDAYQEFWLGLPRNALRFRPAGPDPERSARAWLMRIAYVTAACRRTRRGIPLGITVQPLQAHDGTTDERDEGTMTCQSAPSLTAGTAPSIDDAAERARLIDRVHGVIGDLPEGYRRPLLLHVVAGLSYEELAADLRCTVNHARVKVHRGLKRVRELLGADGERLPDRALMGLFVPLLASVPVVPVPSAAAFVTKKALGTKVFVGKSTTAAGQTPIALKVMLTAACLAVTTALAVQAVAMKPAAPVARPALLAGSTTPAMPVAPVLAAPLDGLPASSAAYGLRRLRAAHAGPLVRVRVGDQQRDIGPLGDGTLDVAALRTFCGRDDGFVVRWYDQSGNGLDLVQPQPARQPRLVVDGEVQVLGNRPAIRIADAEQWLDAGTTTTVGSITALVGSDRGGLYADWKVLLASHAVYDRRYFRGEINHTTFDAVGSTPSVFYVNGARSSDSAPLDNGKVVTADLPQPIANEALRLGNDQYQTHVRGWGGYVAEVVIFPRTLARSDREALTRAGRTWLAGETTASR